MDMGRWASEQTETWDFRKQSSRDRQTKMSLSKHQRKLVLHRRPFHEDHFDYMGECVDVYGGRKVNCVVCKDWQHDIASCAAWADLTSIGDRIMFLHLINLCRTCFRAMGVRHSQKGCALQYKDWPQCTSRNLCPWACRLRFKHSPILCQGTFDPFGITMIRMHHLSPKSDFLELLEKLNDASTRNDFARAFAMSQAKATSAWLHLQLERGAERALAGQQCVLETYNLHGSEYLKPVGVFYRRFDSHILNLTTDQFLEFGHRHSNLLDYLLLFDSIFSQRERKKLRVEIPFPILIQPGLVRTYRGTALLFSTWDCRTTCQGDLTSIVIERDRCLPHVYQVDDVPRPTRAVRQAVTKAIQKQKEESMRTKLQRLEKKIKAEKSEQRRKGLKVPDSTDVYVLGPDVTVYKNPKEDPNPPKSPEISVDILRKAGSELIPVTSNVLQKPPLQAIAHQVESTQKSILKIKRPSSSQTTDIVDMPVMASKAAVTSTVTSAEAPAVTSAASTSDKVATKTSAKILKKARAKAPIMVKAKAQPPMHIAAKAPETPQQMEVQEAQPPVQILRPNAPVETIQPIQVQQAYSQAQEPIFRPQNQAVRPAHLQLTQPLNQPYPQAQPSAHNYEVYPDLPDIADVVQGYWNYPQQYQAQQYQQQQSYGQVPYAQSYGHQEQYSYASHDQQGAQNTATYTTSTGQYDYDLNCFFDL